MLNTSDPTCQDETAKMSFSEAIKIIDAAAVYSRDVSEKERKEALSACERLRASLETPIEQVLRLSFSVLSTFICLDHSILYLLMISDSHGMCRSNKP